MWLTTGNVVHRTAPGTVRHIFMLLICILLAGGSAMSLRAQVTASPYSYFGLGDLTHPGFMQHQTMGRLAVAVRSPSYLNFVNPASLSALKLTAFEGGFTTKNSRLRSASHVQENLNTELAYLALGFPAAEGWGISFGLLPFNNMNYHIESEATLPGGERIVRRFNGEGSIYRFYLNTGYELVSMHADSDRHGLSLGASFSYVFGKMRRREAQDYFGLPHTFNLRTTRSLSVSDVLFDFGLQHTFRIKNDIFLHTGLRYAAGSNMNTRLSQVTERYVYESTTTGTRTIIKDSLPPLITNSKVTTPYPGDVSAGLTLAQEDHWLIGAEVRYAPWSQARFQQVPNAMADNVSVSVGGQITPDPNAINTYRKLVQYRAGFFYESGYLSINNQKIATFGMTFGLGLPLRQIGSRLNMGVSLGQRGTTANNLIQEQFAQLFFGFTFNDKWFIQRKIQ